MGAHNLNADQRHREQKDAHAVRADRNESWIIAKEANEELRADLDQREHGRKMDRCARDRQRERFLYPVVFLRAEIISDDRLHAVIDADDRHDEQDREREDGAHGPNGHVAAVLLEPAIQDGVHKAPRELHRERRHADGGDGENDPSVKAHVSQSDPEHAAPAPQKAHYPRRRSRLRDEGGQRRSPHAPAKPVNKQDQEDDVERGVQDHRHHGDARMPLGADDAVEAEAEELEHGAQQDDADELARIGERCRAPAEERQDGVQKDEARDRERQRCDEHQGDAIAKYSFGACEVFLSQADGDARRGAGTDEHPEGHEDQGDGEGESHAGDCERPHHLPHEDAVDDAVHRGHDGAHDRGGREADQELQNGFFAEALGVTFHDGMMVFAVSEATCFPWTSHCQVEKIVRTVMICCQIFMPGWYNSTDRFAREDIELCNNTTVGDNSSIKKTCGMRRNVRYDVGVAD